MTKLSLALIASGLLALGAPAAFAASVSMVDSAFSPSTIKVTAGEGITFTNNGTLPHNAIADDGTFSTPLLNPGESRTISISQPGTYPYYCSLHGAPGGIGMAGTIRVAEGSEPVHTPLPQTASPLPLIALAGAVMLVAGALLGRRAGTR